VLYKAAPVWQEPPDVRDLLDASSPDITEDTVGAVGRASAPHLHPLHMLMLGIA
jgi:hypothetical protein